MVIVLGLKMVKRLCKYNRHDIVESLGEIQSLVCSPLFVCCSCARSASQAGKLTKKALKVKRKIAGQEMIIQRQEQHSQSSHCH
jgi:tartrate dehydratase alpha subunit/fumarate hydratase class I-like protein